jgi:hypothetical protein
MSRATLRDEADIDIRRYLLADGRKEASMRYGNEPCCPIGCC